ncbi:cholesterol transporter ABCA5-like isoform X3 [Styela clava]
MPPEVTIWRQTVTLIKRNFIAKIRIKQATIQEVFMPIYFVVLLAVLKSFAYKPVALPAIPSSDIATTVISPPPTLRTIFTAPNFVEAQTFMKSLNDSGLLPSLSYEIFDSQAAMDTAYKNLTSVEQGTTVGILFQNSTIRQYALRFPFGRIGDSFVDLSQSNCRQGNGSDTFQCPANNYLFSGFAGLQMVIDTMIAKTIDPNFTSTTISARIMPKDATLSNTDAFLIIGPLYLVIAMGPFLTFLLVFVVYEKEKKIKEGMKMMGLSDLAYWFSWGTVYVASLFVMTLVMTLIGYFGNLFPLSNFFLVFLLFFIYGLSIEMLGFMLTPFFSKARTAGAVGGFISIIMSLVFLAIQLAGDFPEPAIWAVSLLSPTAFSFAMGKVFLFEVTGQGAHFYNIAEGPKPLYIGLVMMIVDIFLYFFLTLYLDSVVPGEYGQRKSPFFCFKPSYWSRSQRGLSRDRALSRRSTSGEPFEGYSQHDFEPVSPDQIGNEAISMSNIRKVFKKSAIFGQSSKSTVAVQRFSLDIYKGQIMALLGHNGAGKTTIFNILTGFVPATSGSASVYGYDVKNLDDMEEIRRMTGVCPQHDILLDFLSVKEHLEVFAGLKGYTGEEAVAEMERVINVVGLHDQRDTFAKKLSGGQKRKLSVGIAILGDPKILILDEPTAGMDPYSRRKLWDLLRSHREDRVTLLTTHFMDEADILADRKAILTCGKLRCVGSSLFLKNRFGCGYHLGVVSKSPEDATRIGSCVNTHIDDAQLQRSVGMEHVYTLPLNQVSKFSELFADFDKRQDELNIQSYGVSMTTLEEVFLKIGEDDDVDEEANGQTETYRTYDNGTKEKYASVGYSNPLAVPETNEDRDSVAINVTNSPPIFDPSQSEGSGESRSGSIILQMMRRTLLINLRNPGYIIFAILLPMVLEIVGTWLFTQQPSASDSGDPDLIDVTYANNLEAYKDKSVLYNGLTGTSKDNFVNNAQSGISFEESTMTDSVLLTDGFYPHSVGLQVSAFAASQAAYLVLYNTSFTRSLPSAINVFSNTLTSFLNGGNPTNIITYSKQWPQVGTQQGTFNGSIFGAAMMVAIAIVLSTSFAASNPVKEREEKIRAQLRVSGVKFINYWFAFLLSDYIIYFVMSLIFIICIVGFQVTGLNNGGAIAALILLLLGWGVACLLASYCGSFLFDRYETVSASWPGLVQLAAIIPYIIVSTLDQTNNREAANACNVVFCILSPYYVGFAGIYYCFVVYLRYLLQGKGTDIPASAYFDWSEPMLPFSILMAYVHIVLLSGILVIADIKKSGGELPGCGRSQVGSSEWVNVGNNDVDDAEDDDVTKERNKVEEISRNQHSDDGPVVLMEGLRKEFTKRTEKSFQSCRKPSDGEDDETVKVAVRNLSMTVYPGEVVGLLGPNGAGKTTALNVLIADVGATAGRVSVGGHSVTSTFSEAFKTMGYCPQSNPLWKPLTLREHLEIYATVRGVPKDKIPATVKNFMEALDIVEHEDKRVKALSGGTQRKLCFAISMLGNPQVVLLDEPSTGMDPKTKRFLWNTISSAFEGTNRGAILTTHYMEEADALCSRVGIMVLGQLRCIGSTQHLKDKFGQGYILEIKLDHQLQEGEEDGEGGEHIPPESDDLDIFVRGLFPSVEEPEKFGNRLTYKIKRDDVISLANVFSSMEEAKTRLGIEEYSFSQSTLEQVFLRFAKEQAVKDEEEQQRAEERKREQKLRKRK